MNTLKSPPKTMSRTSITQNGHLSSGKRGGGPGRRHPVATEFNAIFGLRQLLGLTGRELAKILCCNQSAITRAEQHGVTTRAAFMQRLAALIEVDDWRLLDPNLAQDIARDPIKLARIKEKIRTLLKERDQIL